MGNIPPAADFNIDFHLTAIRELIKALPKAKADVAECKLSLGQNIKAIKDARPHTWIEIVKAECGLRRRAAYNYLAIAEGKPVEQHRAKNRERVARHRALRNAQNEVRQAQISKLNAQVDRLKTEISELQDGKALKTENVRLHAILKKIGETLGVAIGLTGHFEQNRDAIVHKLNAAKNTADAAVANSVPTSSSRKTTLDGSLFAKAMSAPTSSEVH
jgi:dynactin complex subunit